jgi:hypothetical protein
VHCCVVPCISFFLSKYIFGAELLTQQRRIRIAMIPLKEIIKYGRDPILVGGRENMNEILVHVPHAPGPVIAFMITTVTRLNFVRP